MPLNAGSPASWAQRARGWRAAAWRAAVQRARAAAAASREAVQARPHCLEAAQWVRVARRLRPQRAPPTASQSPWRAARSAAETWPRGRRQTRAEQLRSERGLFERCAAMRAPTARGTRLSPGPAGVPAPAPRQATAERPPSGPQVRRRRARDQLSGRRGHCRRFSRVTTPHPPAQRSPTATQATQRQRTPAVAAARRACAQCGRRLRASRATQRSEIAALPAPVRLLAAPPRPSRQDALWSAPRSRANLPTYVGHSRNPPPDRGRSCALAGPRAALRGAAPHGGRASLPPAGR